MGGNGGGAGGEGGGGKQMRSTRDAKPLCTIPPQTALRCVAASPLRLDVEPMM